MKIALEEKIDLGKTRGLPFKMSFIYLPGKTIIATGSEDRIGKLVDGLDEKNPFHILSTAYGNWYTSKYTNSWFTAKLVYPDEAVRNFFEVSKSIRVYFKLYDKRTLENLQTGNPFSSFVDRKRKVTIYKTFRHLPKHHMDGLTELFTHGNPDAKEFVTKTGNIILASRDDLKKIMQRQTYCLVSTEYRN